MSQQLNNPFVPQPPTYIPPAQQYKGMYQPVASPAPAETYAYQPVSIPRTEKQKGKLFKIAFLITIGFVVLSHHVIYRVVNSIWSAFTGKAHEITCEIGCPTTHGVLLHSVVFFLYVLVILYS